VCGEHYTDLTSPCVVDDCANVGMNVIAMRGHSIDTGEYRESEVRMCNECVEEFRASAAVTINGVRMIHDGHGHLKALPSNIGRG
jgi:hypothetical protein